MKIHVLGGGAWGTALAINASHNASAHSAHPVTLWVRNPEQAASMQAQRENQRYLAGIALPESLHIHSTPLPQWVNGLASDDLLIIATPMSALREFLTALRDCKAAIVWLCKGFERPFQESEKLSKGLLAHEIQALVAPNLRAGVLSGPSFAQEVATRQPTALVAASTHADVREALVTAFHNPSLRVYANEDIVGVEVGGAVKNVLAIATGLCDGLQLGLNARAALITRGLAEMTRLGIALGAHAETFMGLSGLGDLVLTATGDLSRNRRVGMALAQGKTLEEATQMLGHVAEGVYSARTVVQRAQGLGVQMPIAQCVVDLLDGRLHAAQAVQQLMARYPAAETFAAM
jgi:glycerol-3-phosphate dehydrogenase (NAD(P)+)